jgi:hypothetical protein
MVVREECDEKRRPALTGKGTALLKPKDGLNGPPAVVLIEVSISEASFPRCALSNLCQGHARVRRVAAQVPILIDAGMDRRRSRLGGPGNQGPLWIGATKLTERNIP